MNKYEKALADVANETVDRLADGYYQPKTVEHFHSSAINILRELVDRATPKIPLDIKDENLKCNGGNPLYGTFITGVCPKCKLDVQLGMNYYPNCGQKLDWRGEDGKTMHN